jgi:hypothetical protein
MIVYRGNIKRWEVHGDDLFMHVSGLVMVKHIGPDIEIIMRGCTPYQYDILVEELEETQGDCTC